MVPYLPHTDEDIAEMLASLGAASLDDLFADIPPEVRLDRPLDLPEGLAEAEVLRRLAALGRRNATDRVSFLGAGIYDHLIPATVPHLVSRSEFYTSYTPYQAEISQGILQAIFEFQTLVCELTGLEVANASLYDGATAAAEGAVLALNSVRGARTVLVSAAVHPFTRQVLPTRFAGTDVRLVEVAAEDGVTSRADLERKLDLAAKAGGPAGTAAFLGQSPNVFGCLEDWTGVADLLHARGALFVLSANPLSLGVLRSPASWGADVAVGDTQPLGLAPWFGGPTAGYIAARRGLLHKMPGRIVGQSVDRDGRRAFLLTLQAREQHIKRQRASSNVCTNQALAALATTVYLATVGRRGLEEAGRQNVWKARWLHGRLTGELGLRPLSARPFFNEFTLHLGRPVEPVLRAMENRGFLAGVPLERLFGPGEGDAWAAVPRAELRETRSVSGRHEAQDALLIAVTEKRTREELDRYVEAMKEALR